MNYFRYITIFSLGILLSTFISGQTNNSKKWEDLIDNFVKESHNNLSFHNGINVFIEKPKNDTDALEKGFQLMQTDTEKEGGWEILAAKNVIIDEQPYRAILYAYQSKTFIALHYKTKPNKYYFRIFRSSYDK